MTFQPQIRQATKADLPQIQTLINTSFPRFYRHFAYHSVSNFSQPTLLAIIGNSAAGFVKLTQFNVGTAKCGLIFWIAVDPQFRRRGVGSVLVEAGVAWLRRQGAGAVFATTQRWNLGALTTLGNVGFVQVGFWGLWRRFGWRVGGFYRSIWFAPYEVVLMRV